MFFLDQKVTFWYDFLAKKAFFLNRNMILAVLQEYLFLIPCLAWCAAQGTKLVLDCFANKKLRKKDIFQTGGMPSGHATFVSAMTMVVGFSSGAQSIEFAMCFVVMSIVCYDAVKLRAAVSLHARALNTLLKKNAYDERIGHSLSEMVAGVLLGGGVALVVLML